MNQSAESKAQSTSKKVESPEPQDYPDSLMTTAQGLTRPQTRSRAAREGGKRLSAPFPLRCGALLIDYVVLVAVVVFGTLIARMLGGSSRSAGSSAETIGFLAALLIALLNLGVLPGLTGLTMGKWATGLRIERNNGSDIGILRALWRHFVGYPLSFLLFGIGFLMAAVSVRGRALHDIIAGTIVVRESSL
jgi:uncharacterized RDD family membrane protein YckC